MSDFHWVVLKVGLSVVLMVSQRVVRKEYLMVGQTDAQSVD